MGDSEIDECVYLRDAIEALDMLDGECPFPEVYWTIFRTLARMALHGRKPYQSELEALQAAFLEAVNAQAGEECA